MTTSMWLAALLCSAPPSLVTVSASTIDDSAIPLRYRDQLTLDVTPVPPAMGALFVPALTESELEPPVIITRDSKRIAVGLVGRRIVLPPGDYDIEIGQGDSENRPRARASVEAGITTLVRPFYSALQLDAVDRRGRRRSADFALVSTDQKGAPVRGRTTDASATRARALLLPEGRYRLALQGDEPARSVVVSMHDEEVLRYRLVLDGDQLIRTELADDEPTLLPRYWRARWRIGADMAFNSSSNQLSQLNGDAIQMGGFTTASIEFDRGVHLLRFGLDVSEAWLGVSSRIGKGLPLQKLTDRAEVEAYYYLRAWRLVGPYVRGTAQASFFETQYVADGPTSVRLENSDGSVELRSVDNGDKVKLAPTFAPLVLQESVGLGVTLIDTEVFSLIARGGPALRQMVYRGTYRPIASSASSVTFRELSDADYVGGEAGASATLRLGEGLWIDSELDGFVPKQQLFDGDTLTPMFRWTNAATLSFNDTLSLRYYFVLHRDDLRLDELQVIQLLSLRAYVSLL